MIKIREIAPDDWREWREMRLQALGDAPYAFESKLGDWQGYGDVEQRWRDRLRSVLFNVIADLDGSPAGMVSAFIEGDKVNLTSLWVAPFARGCGVSDALIESVIHFADTARRATIVLTVMEGNSTAIALYRRHGFFEEGDVTGAGRAKHRMVRQ